MITINAVWLIPTFILAFLLGFIVCNNLVNFIDQLAKEVIHGEPK